MLKPIIAVLKLLIAKSELVRLVLTARQEQQSSADEGGFALVTNMHDLIAATVDECKPQPDPAIAADRSINSINFDARLSELARAWPEEPPEEFEFDLEPRWLSEIETALDLLWNQIWYNKHQNVRISIEEGHHKIVPESEYSREPYRPDEVVDTVWTRALAAARRTEEEVGLDRLGLWTDFEWGMLNGKMSALRWVLGHEWDWLDT